MDNSQKFSWDPESQPPLESVVSDGVEVKRGDRVRLRPMGRADLMDMLLNGRLATVVSIERDYENRIHLAVTIDDDPGKDLGEEGKPGHRFFFGIDEIETSDNFLG